MSKGQSLDSTPTPCNLNQLGAELFAFATELFPLHRAITGAGVRATLDLIAKRIRIKRYQVPSGTSILDWEVPKEWSMRDAFVKLGNGHRLIDVERSNLHVISYSLGADQRLSWDNLQPHLHTLPDRPDWIPFRTAHYLNTWGFCINQQQRDELQKHCERDSVHVHIDAEQHPGHLDYAECYLPGSSDCEFLLTTHICHPSLANDNVSGMVVATEVARYLSNLDPLPISIRVLFAPATIGAIAWLAQNRDACHRIRGGLVLSNLGDRGQLTYKRSRRENALIDRVAEHTLAVMTPGHQVRPFTPWGYDERQYCSPGFDLPMGRLTRTPEGEYPEYHTSADDLSLIRADSLAHAVQAIVAIILSFAERMRGSSSSDHWTERMTIGRMLEDLMQEQAIRRRDASISIRDSQLAESTDCERMFLNLRPFAEPRLDRYGLYSSSVGSQDLDDRRAVLWMLNLSDGKHSLRDIADRSHIEPDKLNVAAKSLVNCGLLRELE